MRIRNTLRDCFDAISGWLSRHLHSMTGKVNQETTEQQPATTHLPDAPSSLSQNDQNLDADFDEIRLKREFTRENFKPHVVVICERRIPSSITIYGFIGGDQQRIIHFPEEYTDGSQNLAPEDYSAYARANLPEQIPLMGKTIGYVVNYSPDHSIEYDLQGNVVCERSKFLEVAEIRLQVGP